MADSEPFDWEQRCPVDGESGLPGYAIPGCATPGEDQIPYEWTEEGEP